MLMKELILDTDIQIDEISIAQTQFNRVRDSIMEVEMPLHLHFKSIHSLNLLMSVSKEIEEHGELIEALYCLKN
ncbi:hypothetical protein BpHYR1_053330 [Brachionus plicatilis]|uniref:Uncharacterized protein n=1 Tax=Brachionus plicatilis TaxID=10195 RepID=A0A3M7PDS2_BRAPC|nr:hypothetical protein BpHYR1_053330 [Brachionus plicatilis]